jgi:hypothetical protein
MNYEEYYNNQIGGALPVFRGSRYQHGMGLGNMFRSFFRWFSPMFKTHALPVLKTGAQTFGNEAIKTAANIATDALHGKKFESAAKERTAEAVNTLASKATSYFQKGSGYKSHTKRKRNNKCKSSKRKRATDIFD